VLYNAAANSESAQPVSDNSSVQNQPPAEPTNVPPQVSENAAAMPPVSQVLQAEHVEHQQTLSPDAQAQPAVCVL